MTSLRTQGANQDDSYRVNSEDIVPYLLDINSIKEFRDFVHLGSLVRVESRHMWVNHQEVVCILDVADILDLLSGVKHFLGAVSPCFVPIQLALRRPKPEQLFGGHVREKLDSDY